MSSSGPTMAGGCGWCAKTSPMPPTTVARRPSDCILESEIENRKSKMPSPRPWANYFLIFLNVFIFFLQIRNPSLMPRYQLNGRALSLMQFMTYAFLHVGWAHLLFNMAVLYVLGNDINLRLGHVGYFAFYLAGAVISGLGFVLSGG